MLAGENLGVATCDIDVQDSVNMTLQSFRKDYWEKGRPVLIRGGLAGLPRRVLEPWTRSKFLEKFGTLDLQVARVRSNQVGAHCHVFYCSLLVSLSRNLV